MISKFWRGNGRKFVGGSSDDPLEHQLPLDKQIAQFVEVETKHGRDKAIHEYPHLARRLAIDRELHAAYFYRRMCEQVPRSRARIMHIYLSASIQTCVSLIVAACRRALRLLKPWKGGHEVGRRTRQATRAISNSRVRQLAACTAAGVVLAAIVLVAALRVCQGCSPVRVAVEPTPETFQAAAWPMYVPPVSAVVDKPIGEGRSPASSTENPRSAFRLVFDRSPNGEPPAIKFWSGRWDVVANVLPGDWVEILNEQTVDSASERYVWVRTIMVERIRQHYGRDMEGFIARSYMVDPVDFDAAKYALLPGQPAVVSSKDALFLRQSPDLNSPSIVTLKPGDGVMAIYPVPSKDEAIWWQVRATSPTGTWTKVGYLKQEYLSPSDILIGMGTRLPS